MKLMKNLVLKKLVLVYLSGPSKTADIEQSLVIGAHRPKSGYVIFIKSNNC